MRLAILLIVLIAGPASAHDRKAQANASAHRSWTAPVFFGYGAAHRRAVRDAWCRQQTGPHLPMGC